MSAAEMQPVLGVNCYYLMTRSADEDLRPGIEQLLDAVVAANISCIRTWAFADGPTQWNALQPAPGQLSQKVLLGLDWLIDSCKQRGLRLLLGLTNYWCDYGGISQYVRWAEGLAADAPVQAETFYISQPAQALYEQFVTSLLLHTNTITGVQLCQEPTILGWEVINEPRCPPSTGISPASMRVWLTAAVRHIKSLTPCQVAIGSEGFWGASTPDMQLLNPYDTSSTGCDWALESAIPGLDLLSYHLYPDHWLHKGSTPSNVCNFSRRWIQSHSRYSRYLGKPVMLTEFGSKRWVMQEHQQQQPAPKAAFWRQPWTWLSKVWAALRYCSMRPRSPAEAQEPAGAVMPRHAFVEEVLTACFERPQHTVGHTAGWAPTAGAFLWMVADVSYPDYDGFTVHAPSGHTNTRDSEQLTRRNTWTTLTAWGGMLWRRWKAGWSQGMVQDARRLEVSLGPVSAVIRCV